MDFKWLLGHDLILYFEPSNMDFKIKYFFRLIIWILGHVTTPIYLIIFMYISSFENVKYHGFQDVLILKVYHDYMVTWLTNSNLFFKQMKTFENL